MDPSPLFILFFGTRPGKRQEVSLPGVSCPYCGQSGTLHATHIPQFVHLFWIPVYRLRPMTFVACSHCRKAYEGDEITPGMQEALQKRLNP